MIMKTILIKQAFEMILNKSPINKSHEGTCRDTNTVVYIPVNQTKMILTSA